MSAFRQAPGAQKDAVLVDVQVVPRASRNRIGPLVGERVKIQLCAPAVEGAANQALIELFAKCLRIPRRQVTIIHGEQGRRKTLRIEGVAAARLANLIAENP